MVARAFVFVNTGIGGGYIVVFYACFCRHGCAVANFGIGRLRRQSVDGFVITSAVSFHHAVNAGLITQRRKDKKMNNNKSAECRFCCGQTSLMPCVFCAGGRLRMMQQQAANFVLRRMGFAARDSFDLHCAALKAAINANGGAMMDNTKADADKRDKKEKGEKDNASGFVDNRRQSCGQKFAAMAAVFFGDGINAVSREEFDAHNQILAAAEKNTQQYKTDNKPAAKNTTSGGKSANKSAKQKGE